MYLAAAYVATALDALAHSHETKQNMLEYKSIEPDDFTVSWGTVVEK